MNEDNLAEKEPKAYFVAPRRDGVSRSLTAEMRWLNFPVKNDAPKTSITVSVDGKIVRRIAVSLADEDPDWWAPLDISSEEGKLLTITVDQLLKGSSALTAVTNTATIPGSEMLYKETLRPQFHFSARRGWLNDPNGLVYFNGEYHLFFQHSPFSCKSSDKYWGQAVSSDLVHWEEIGEALYPDEFGEMWSGSAVVDDKNTSGFGDNGIPPLILIYTAAGDPFVQCLAYSIDGRRFMKYAKNPVVGNIAEGNRDPKVFWHEPKQRWVQTLYVKEETGHTVHFLTSPNLRDWTRASTTPGQTNTTFLYECPDFFELPLDGHPENRKWILTGADSAYSVGSFDGVTFVPETQPLSGHQGCGFYAAQTFSNMPANRRIQIGWWRTETRCMPFNQSMSLPLELNLISTLNGPRLTWTPAAELESLRVRSHVFGPATLSEATDTTMFTSIHCELLEIRAEFSPKADSTVSITVRGIRVIYDAQKQEVIVNGHRASAPLQGVRQRLTVYADRTGLEVFASDGLTFVPMPVNLSPEDTSFSITVSGSPVFFTHLDIHELKSAWPSPV